MHKEKGFGQPIFRHTKDVGIPQSFVKPVELNNSRSSHAGQFHDDASRFHSVRGFNREVQAKLVTYDFS